MRILATAAVWLSVEAGSGLQAQVRIIIHSIPENTPHDASLYLAGTVNDWNPGHPDWTFTRLDSQRFELLIPHTPSSLRFKITRGNWISVEGRKDGLARRNRSYQFPGGGSQTIEISVASWEDLSNSRWSWYNLLMLLSAFQGFLLILAINGIQDNNVRANRRLSLIILLTSLALLARIAAYDPQLFSWQPKLFFLPEWISFLYAPLFFYYLRELFKLDSHTWRQKLPYFVPAALHVLAFTPLLFRSNESVKFLVIDETLHPYFALVGGLALAFNGWFWWKIWRMVTAYENESAASRSFESQLQHLRSVMLLTLSALLLWSAAYLLSGLGYLADLNIGTVSDAMVNLAWVVFAATNFFLGYMAIHQPEILRLPKPVTRYKDSPLENAEMTELQQRLHHAMETDQVYLRPDLTLSDLAEHVRTNTHTISRVINEGFGQSFYDYINGYRVKAFTSMIARNEHQRETFLALALRAGFNSKTTFNRAFKKVTGMTPRQYVQQLAEEDPAIAPQPPQT